MPRVLVVEDNAVNLELLIALLEQEGCAVLSVPTALAGLELARAARPALIFMDVQLPGMTGYEATRLLKTDPATAAIPVMAITAHAVVGEEARAQTAGCDGYLTKPLTTAAFRAVLERLLKRSAPE